MAARPDGVHRVADPAAMGALAAAVMHALPAGAVVFLCGPLGAGKTTFVRGALRAAGHEGAVKSPTYTLVEPYEIGRERVYHLDLYRLQDAEDVESMGIREYLDGQARVFIEWPEHGLAALPAPDLTVSITDLAADGAGDPAPRAVTLRWRVPAP